MFVSYCMVKITLLFLLDCYSSGELVYKQNYTRIFVEKGKNVVLNCTCCLHNESSWTGPKILAITKMDINEGETYAAGLILNPQLHDLNVDIIGDNESNECRLVVRNFSEVGVGHYICEYWKSGIVYLHSFTVHLKTPPNNLTFINTIETRQHKLIRGIEGQKLDITCTVNSGKHQETLILTDNSSTVQSGESGKIVYSFVPSRNDNMKLYECSAVSSALKKPLTDEVILDIQYKPSLTVNNPAPEKLIENTSTQVCCQGNSNPPMDQIKWKGTVNYSVVNNTTSCLTFSPIHRTNTQTYTCFASNRIGISESHIYIKVLYPPLVSVSYTITGQTINLHCHPRGEPNNYTFAKWYYRSEFDETIRKIEGTQTSKLTIITQSNKTLLAHVGMYVCRASNGIITRNGTLYQEGAVYVQFEAPPIFISTNKRVQFGQYRCELNITVVLYSKLDIIPLKISNDNSVLHPKITKRRTHTHDIFHGFKLKVHEITVVFHLGLATEEEFVNYTIDACILKDRPEPPNNITVVQYENHMILLWIPGFNGGFNQVFFIQHRNADTEWWKTTGPIKDSFQNEIKYTIHELVSNKQYCVCMFSRNVIGDSEKTSVTEARSFEYEQITLLVYNDCSVIFGNIVGGMLIYSIVSHIYCRLRRKRRSNATIEITPEGQYDEIGTINYNNMIVDPITNFELDNNDHIPTDVVRNDDILSVGGDSSSASSFIGQTGDGYENAYQAINPSIIEMHQYSSVIPNIYQNTIISPASAATTSAEYINTAIDKYTKP